jgi:hypothetical protein
MSEVSDPARALGLGGEYRPPSGPPVPVAEWTYDVQVGYSKYLRDKALDAVRECRNLFEPDEYKDQRAQVNRDWVAGEYAFGGELVRKSFDLVENTAHLFWLQARAWAQENKKPDPDFAALYELAKADPVGVFTALIEANRDPTRPPASTTDATPAGGS